jgi:biopolymer transport protein ExbD
MKEGQMRRRPYRAFAAPADAPISALNTTPLIDVMLVLLIMFIVTLPLTTHKVEVDLPTRPPEPQAPPEVHVLAMDDLGRLAWDGAPLAEAALPARLAAFKTRGPTAELHFRAEGETRYEDFDRVLAVVKRAEIARLGFVGNDRFVQAISR